MTAVASTLDLVEQASRRARVGALLGRLLVAEPSPDLAPLVATIDGLGPLASGDGALATEYERLFLREVPLYESVFLGNDGQRGGPAVAAVVATYAATGFDEFDQWRVAGPDHLGLELLCYAHLCADEARAWDGDQPDRAARAVEAERDLLRAHLGQWGEIAMAAVGRRSRGTPYASLAAAVSDFLAVECERLRPDPDHPGLPAIEIEPLPSRLGPARLARWLLSPARCGAFFDTDDLTVAARAIGSPWRPSDPRSRFRQVVEDAIDGGDLDTVLTALRPALDRWHAFHAEHERIRDGDGRVWRRWRLRTEQTVALLDLAAHRARPDGDDTAARAVLTDTLDRLRQIDHPLAHDAARALTDLLEGSP